jgi:hypothetical protein
MAAISALLLLDAKGKAVLSRDYRSARAAPPPPPARPCAAAAHPPPCRRRRRGDIPLKAADRFLPRLGELEDAGRASPVFQDGGVSYIHVQHTNLYLVAMARTNVNAATVLAFLHKIIEIFKHYFHEVRAPRRAVPASE